uniref:Ycf37 n=1 Tax=Porolithon onkodes TaxID=231751 RepID=A0A2Z2L5M0_9FLOR|nr:hypothetical protein [Porolithon onkodes]ASB29650.1 hypothetical protein [Porolithon onkodes]
MPYLYFFILLMFLLSFSLFITFQLYKICIFELFAKNKILENMESRDINQLFAYVKYLLHKKRWLRAIYLLESQVTIPLTRMHEYFNIIGFVYDKMNQYYLAELYYKVSLSYNKDYITALKNLSRIKDIKS